MLLWRRTKLLVLLLLLLLLPRVQLLPRTAKLLPWRT
jgi:hypothetical protein